MKTTFLKPPGSRAVLGVVCSLVCSCLTAWAQLGITTEDLPDGQKGTAYSATLTASGGDSPYAWSVVAGQLPSGLSLNDTTGVLDGTPTRAGFFNFTVQVTDSASQTASSSFTVLITNAPANPYANAPGGPILVVTNAANPFSQYYAEILLAEGLNQFALLDLASLSASALTPYDVVILGEGSLTSQQVTDLADWVNTGGNLIAMKPDSNLATLLGLTAASGSTSEGYLLVNTSSGPGVGIVGETIQFHGTADHYNLVDGAISLATLYSGPNTATAFPAVTLRSVGVNGGQAAAFTYDLAKSIVYTRQGNPAWAGLERDGVPTVRNNDLFYGDAEDDPQPDWIDRNKIAIPQADEQQRLLANMITAMNADRKLMPRFWYFPNFHRAVVVMTADNHTASPEQDGRTAQRFDEQMAADPAGASADPLDWETIRSSAYLYPGENMAKTGKSALDYHNAGFEIGFHLSAGCAEGWTEESLGISLAQQFSDFAAKYPNLPPPDSHRIHCIAWSEFTTLPELQLQYGIRLDVNYYHFPESWLSNYPGFMTGSGMAMRFARANGEMIDAYQAATQMTDESGQAYPATVNTLLDRALGPEGYYGAFVANMHTDSDTYIADRLSSVWSAAIIDSAKARGVPVISGRQLLTWLDARNGSSLHSINGNQLASALTFSVTADANARGLHAMAPIPTGKTVPVDGVTRNGTPVVHSLRNIKGVHYAIFPAETGDYQVTFADDIVPPQVTGITPANGETGVSVTTTVTVSFSESMDEATINPDTITLRTTSGGVLVPAAVAYNPATQTATAVLTPENPLAYATVYTVTVKGGPDGVKDIAGNELSGGDVTSTFGTTAQTFSLWPNATPGNPASGDENPTEVGVKFRSSVNGYVTGIRFYKGAANTGIHVGNLWTAGGANLGSATFTGETSSGWQQVNFIAPVPITAGVTYVASYFAPSGRYAVDFGYFGSDGFANEPLYALGDGEAPGNGVYRHPGPGFPSSYSTAPGFSAANYWVDVVFVETLPPDLT
ncbi:MAG: DUF4082 domain-containing protein, partial [Verrucomicrobia bacterium]|nr:DUF4082 domain-containing protein [Verrucomicrobiota bacterium]